MSIATIAMRRKVVGGAALMLQSSVMEALILVGMLWLGVAYMGLAVIVLYWLSAVALGLWDCIRAIEPREPRELPVPEGAAPAGAIDPR